MLLEHVPVSFEDVPFEVLDAFALVPLNTRS